MKKDLKINYIYYGILFFSILATTFASITSIEKAKAGYRFFFMFHGTCQSFLEVLFLIIIGYFIEQYLKKVFFKIFIALSFLFLLTHFVDFILMFIMDLSFYEALSLMLNETLTNFIELLILTNIPLIGWMFITASVILIPILGVYFYFFCKKISNFKPLVIKNETLFQTSFCVIFALFFWDVLASPSVRSDIYQKCQRTLPWKTTFLHKQNIKIKLKNHLKLPNDNDYKTALSKIEKLDQKPSIYIFVIESLRDDFITEENCPNIYQFKKDNIHADLSLSNANNTQSSWFSIFHSKYPLYWQKQNKQFGALPLYLLKHAGYNINVFSSSGLNYYKMDELLFGKNQNLLNTYHSKNNEIAYKSDNTIIQKAKNYQNFGNVNILFLESTHFNYSWPDDYKLKFTPIINNMSSALTPSSKKHIEKIKNRYRNSIYYIDTLFADYINSLKEKNLYENAIIAVVGDHGEEFFEQGQLFHASHLSHVQTNVLLTLKLGNSKKEIPKNNLKIASQVDIFPTILDHLFSQSFDQFFDGKSLYNQNKSPYVISTRYSGGISPSEFFIHEGTNKITLKFNKKNIFDTKELRILSIKNLKDENIILKASKEKSIINETLKALDSIFKTATKNLNKST